MMPSTLKDDDHGISGGPYGNVAAPTATELHPTNAAGTGRSIRDDGKSNEALHNEYLRAFADLEARYPEAAKRMNAAGLDIKDPNAVILARDQADSIMREEQGKELQKSMMGAAVAVAGGAALLGGAGGLLGISSAKNGEVSTAALDGNDPLKALNINRASAANPMLALGLQNPQYDQLIAAASIKDPMAFADPQNADRGTLGNLSTPAVPNLIAALEKAQGAGAGRTV